jgi:hypothetical protein
MTRNNAEFKPQNISHSASTEKIPQENTISKAQQRRLTDVYNAKLDLAARMERSLQKLTNLNDELEALIEKRKNASAFLVQKIESLKNLTEPDGGRELHEYLREVEHLRMEYFRKEAEIEVLFDGHSSKTSGSSFWADLTDMKAGHLLKLSFCGMLPLLITILISALVIAAAIIAAMKI